ncbi:hypothetical protein K504DRAFT_503560 [Pleomassaria siparia CBS 279.74]|uniref:Uncharacterized protein n=1 Tax=Pleomassaria siparia CBS 279.74 TaxID=1314801 RepID=A0A6G1K684_9PLEO|nr:hypothetical protein K504DRAFT_503560 [Pleomassaria siparia CBS 279.74]
MAPPPAPPSAYLNLVPNNVANQPPTPQHTHHHHQTNPPSSHTSPRPASHHYNPHPTTTTQLFTPFQQSLQARNKPFNTRSSSPTSPHLTEPYDVRQKRDRAAGILDNVETLLWYSMARNESISQTRQHFADIVLGADADGEKMWREEWELSERERNGGGGGGAVGMAGSPRASPRGKERRKRTSDARS